MLPGEHKSLIDRTRERGTKGPSLAENRAKAGPAIPVLETLVICTLSSEPSRPQPEVVDTVESVPLEEGWPERAVQLGHDIATADRQSLVSPLREYKDVFAFRPEEMQASPQL